MNARTVFALAILLLLGVGSRVSADDAKNAETLYRAGKWDEARLAYEVLTPKLEGEARAAALTKLGYCWQRLHKHDKAIPVFRQVFELDGISNTQICLTKLRLGYALRMTQQSDEAVQMLDEASRMKDVPTNLTAETLLNAAWELNSHGNPDEALTRFRKIEHIKDVHQNYIASAYLNIGRVHQNSKQYEDALKTYRKVATLKVVAATNRARARVYALECESLLAGDQAFHIRPFVTQVTTNSAVLQWVSQGESARGTVIVHQATDEALTLVTIAGESEIELVPLKDTICHLHTAKLAGLRPHVRYRYEVKSGTKLASGSFRTAPAANSNAEFSFSLIGDTQSYHTGLQPLLDAMGNEKTDFVLHVGDVTDRGNMWGEWKAGFFDPGHRYLSQSTFWPAYGNHDGGPYFPALFRLNPHLYYSFDWGDVHFVVLDSYGAGTGKIGRPKQLEWLEADLKQNSKKWTIAAMHVPMIATRTGIQSFGTDDFLPLLEKHAVDIVFSGHHPLYRRYYPLGSKGRKPILHITSGGGGGPVGGFMPSPVLSTGINLNHYCRIDVRNDRLTLAARTATGTVIDRFELRKNEPTQKLGAAVDTAEARRIISLYQELLTDRTYELLLSTADRVIPGESMTVELNLKRLPRGPLDISRLPKDAQLKLSPSKDSQWKFAPTTVSFTNECIKLSVVAPSNVSATNGNVRPVARIRLQLVTGDRSYEPYDATARIDIAP